jgi:hypothetical protein
MSSTKFRTASTVLWTTVGDTRWSRAPDLANDEQFRQRMVGCTGHLANQRQREAAQEGVGCLRRLARPLP